MHGTMNVKLIKIIFGRFKINLGLRAKRILPVCMQYIGTLGRARSSSLLLLLLRQYLSLGGIQPNPIEGCDLIAALTPCKQKHRLNFSPLHQFQDICFMA